MKKIILTLVFLVMCTSVGFSTSQLPSIYVDGQKASLSHEMYIENDEVMISLEDLSTILSLESDWDETYKSGGIEDVRISINESRFVNKGLETWSVNGTVEKDGRVYVPLKAVSSALICEVTSDVNKIDINKLTPKNNKNLKIIYDTRYSGKILSYEWISTIDCSYDDIFNDVPKDKIQVMLIKNLMANEEKQLGIEASVLEWSNTLYVNNEYNKYDLDELYQHIEVNKGVNTLFFSCTKVDSEEKLIYNLVEPPALLNEEQAKEAIKKLLTEKTKIAYFMMEDYYRENTQVIKIEPIEGYEEVFICVSTGKGIDLLVENPEKVKIKGIWLNYEDKYYGENGGYRLLTADDSIPVIYTGDLDDYTSTYDEHTVPFMKDGIKIDETYGLKGMNDQIRELFGRSMDCLSIESNGVAILGQYKDADKKLSEIDAFFLALFDEYNVSREKKLREEENQKQNDFSQAQLAINKFGQSLVAGQNAFNGLYLPNVDSNEPIVLGEYPLEYHARRNIPDKLPGIYSGILYFKGQMTFERETKKLINHGYNDADTSIYLDGIEVYNSNQSGDKIIVFPAGTHLVEIYQKDSLEELRIGYGLNISTPYEYKTYLDPVDLSQELSDGTEVYLLESISLPLDAETVVDLKDYTGRMGLILKSGTYGNWKIINDDQVDLTFIVMSTKQLTSLDIENNLETRVITNRGGFDNFLESWHIGPLKNSLHYSMVNYISDLDNYNPSKEIVNLFVDESKIALDRYAYAPILLREYGLYKNEAMISFEALSDITEINYFYNEGNQSINLSTNTIDLTYQIEGSDWIDNYDESNRIYARVEQVSGHYYVDLGMIASELGYSLEWDVDIDRLNLKSSPILLDELNTIYSLPDDGFRVYEFDQTDYVKTFIVKNFEEVEWNIIKTFDEIIFTQKVDIPEQQDYKVDTGSNAPYYSNIVIDGEEHGFNETFTLTKGSNILNYCFRDELPDSLMLTKQGNMMSLDQIAHEIKNIRNTDIKYVSYTNKGSTIEIESSQNSIFLILVSGKECDWKINNPHNVDIKAVITCVEDSPTYRSTVSGLNEGVPQYYTDQLIEVPSPEIRIEHYGDYISLDGEEVIQMDEIIRKYFGKRIQAFSYAYDGVHYVDAIVTDADFYKKFDEKAKEFKEIKFKNPKRPSNLFNTSENTKNVSWKKYIVKESLPENQFITYYFDENEPSKIITQNSGPINGYFNESYSAHDFPKQVLNESQCTFKAGRITLTQDEELELFIARSNSFLRVYIDGEIVYEDTEYYSTVDCVIPYEFKKGSHEILIEHMNDSKHFSNLQVVLDKPRMDRKNYEVDKVLDYLGNNAQTYCISIDKSSSSDVVVDVHLDDAKGPIILALNSEEFVRWNIVSPNDVLIKALVLSGNSRSQILNYDGEVLVKYFDIPRIKEEEYPKGEYSYDHEIYGKLDYLVERLKQDVVSGFGIGNSVSEVNVTDYWFE